ncbi:hypothetical protein [Aquidulcibacter sp.]|jgi:hypothetical protein|uniref:hypothetical protein n=1 Tax=Aquidulcibacter sp. TaxID=2052990 RepID=UPI0037C07E51
MLNRKAPQNIEVKKRKKDLFDSLLTISKERNQIAHGNFVYSGEYPETLFLRRGWGKDEAIYLYDLATLDALVSKIYEVGEQVMTLRLEVIATAPQRYETGRWIFPTPVVLSIRPEDLGMPPA